jgi:hypothetical protein
MREPILLIIISLIHLSASSQRRTEIIDGGTEPSYIPVATLGQPDCNFKNSGLVLTFNEEFNNGVLDQTKWNASYPWGIANSDSSNSWCDPAEIRFTGQSVKLGCNRRTNNNVILNNQIVTCDYAIGVISTKQLFGFGYYEIRCRIPIVAELWPAFWMHGDCGQEIDIFEFAGRSYKSSKRQPFRDGLSACRPFLPRWYVPQECATANPYFSSHSPFRENTCSGQLGERRSISTQLFFSNWEVKKTISDFTNGCVYDNIEVDVDFHNEWHTFGVSFTQEGITWFIDSVPQVTEYRYFTKPFSYLPAPGNDKFIPACLSSYCSGNLSRDLFEQVNIPQGNNKMRVILNNNHLTMPDYNLYKWVDNKIDWEDGYLEIDYFRFYEFTTNDPSVNCYKEIQDCGFNLVPTISEAFFTVKSDNGILTKKFHIINNFGQVIFEGSFKGNSHSFNLDAPAGVYYFGLFCNGSVKYQPIIILKQ